MKLILWLAIGSCFAYACVTDCRTRLVYNFTWWIALAAIAGLWVIRASLPETEQLIELLVFILLQFILFDRMYGRADVYAFCVCALAGSTLGFSLADYLLHMLISVSLLATVQWIRHNITSHGNLKVPVPFLPYITLAFCVTLWYHYIC